MNTSTELKYRVKMVRITSYEMRSEFSNLPETSEDEDSVVFHHIWNEENDEEEYSLEERDYTSLEYSWLQEENECKIKLEAGENPNIPDSNGLYMLHVADNACSRLLLRHGAYPSPKNRYEETPLHTSKDYEKISTLLSFGADVNTKNNYNQTPLHLHSEGRIVKELLNASALFLDDRSGNTPLFYEKDFEAVQHLVYSNVNINKLNNRNENCLWYCRAESIPELVKAGIYIDVLSCESKTAFHFNTLRSRTLITCLQDIGEKNFSRIYSDLAFQIKRVINCRDHEGKTALFYHIEADRSFRELVRFGSDINALDYKGRNCCFGHSNIHHLDVDDVERMYEHEVNIQVKDNFGKDVLSFQKDDRVRRVIQDKITLSNLNFNSSSTS